MNTGAVVSTFHFIFMVKGEVIFVKGHTDTRGEWRYGFIHPVIHIFGARLGRVNTVRVIKSRRLKWAGHVARMGAERGVYSVLVGKPG